MADTSDVYIDDSHDERPRAPRAPEKSAESHRIRLTICSDIFMSVILHPGILFISRCRYQTYLNGATRSMDVSNVCPYIHLSNSRSR